LIIGACSATESSEINDDTNNTTSVGGAGQGGNGQGLGDGGTILSGPGSGGNTATPCDPQVPDFDQDGWTLAEGDCNDCDANVNPSAVEVPTDPMDPMADMVDENCDGEVDEPFVACDDNIVYTDTDPNAAARAIEICEVATPNDKNYGLLQAFWAHANGTQAAPAQLPQFGLQGSFGSNVQTQEGAAMLVMSSGFARLPGQPGAATNNSASAQGFNSQTPPPMFPQDVPGCTGSMTIYDDIALQLRLRAPSNATGFKFRFKFYSFEFAEYVCTSYNDQFIALVDPPPQGSVNGNVTFDSMANPVSVNIAYFDVCDPVANNDFAMWCSGTCPPMPNPYCPLGPGELLGTGFDTGFGGNEDAGATSWLQTTAPIAGGEEFNIRFAIWDTGDNAYDSSVLVDSFGWVATPGTTVVTLPPPD
jgi:hypothetical protein